MNLAPMLNDPQPNYEIKRCPTCNHFFDTDYIHVDCGMCVGCCGCAEQLAIIEKILREFSQEQLAIIEKILSEDDNDTN